MSKRISRAISRYSFSNFRILYASNNLFLERVSSSAFPVASLIPLIGSDPDQFPLTKNVRAFLG
jgi:hypothetical protein